MNAFIFDIIKQYAKKTIGIWTVLAIFDILLMRFLKAETLVFGSVFTVGLAGIVSPLLMVQSRWIVFWRRTSKSIYHYWSTIGLILALNLILNCFCYFALRKLIRVEDLLMAEFQPTYVDLIGLTLISFSINLVMLSDYKTAQINQALKPAKQFLTMMGFYAWIVLIFFMFGYSRLLGYVVFEITLLAYFIYLNNFVLSSIRLAVRHKFFLVGLSLILFGSAVCFQYENSKKGVPSILLGYLGPEKVWSFSDLERVNDPLGLYEYFENYRLSNASELMQVIKKIEQLCPRDITDVPSCVTCLAKDAPNRSVTIRTKLEDSEILQFLDSQSEYAKLFGLFAARRFEQFPPEIWKKIEDLSKQPGNLNPIALKTLKHHGKGKERRACFQIFEPPK